MLPTNLPPTPEGFTAALYDLMKQVNPGVDEMELYEFRYALNNITPEQGWASVDLDPPDDIDRRINDRAFFTAVELKTRREGKIVLDESVLGLTRMLLVGLVDGAYALDWIKQRFYFDIRGFYFLVRITYLTPEVRARLGGRPMRAFEQRQTVFERSQDVGYKAFRAANAEIDQAFIECVLTLIARKGAPIVIAIAGATAAGKTEIVDRLRIALEGLGQRVTAIEMDNFLTDRDYREAHGIDQRVDAFPRQQLAARLVLGGRFRRTAARDGDGLLAQVGDQRAHRRRVGLVFLAARVEFGFDDGH